MLYTVLEFLLKVESCKLQVESKQQSLSCTLDFQLSTFNFFNYFTRTPSL